MLGLKATIIAVIITIGESVIGLIPIATPFVLNNFARPTTVEYNCNASNWKCEENSSFHYDEANIVTVVFSGLAILSLIPLGKNGRRVSCTGLTYAIAIAQIVLITFASVLYALSVLGIAQHHENVTWELLAVSLLGSFYLAAEEAWLEVIRKP
jgi:hypothetical protein